jgi:putative addiction module component (TIGR02574 family)
MNVKGILAKALSLPVEDRAALAEALLRSMHLPDEDIDREWMAEAERRLDEVRSGRAAAIPADEVFAEIRKRISR